MNGSGTTRIPSLGPRGEGWVALQVILMIVIAFAGGLGPALPVSDQATIGALRVIGYGLAGGGVIVILWSMALLRGSRALTAVPRPVDTAELVDRGPYAVIRHPIYAGLIVAFIGATLLWSAWLSLIATVALFVVLDLKRRREEAWLLERYPDYAAYRARTKALVPFLY
jgi:protein-S-isoprenylcysteine O-methyltransferase Ste14